MEISELNGKYFVSIASDIFKHAPGYHDFGDATIEVVDGQFNGMDSGKISWSGNFTLSDDQEHVDIKATIDPRTGVPDAVVMHNDGQIRREPVTHKTRMKLTRVNTSFRMSGTLKVGPVEIEVSVRPVE